MPCHTVAAMLDRDALKLIIGSPIHAGLVLALVLPAFLLTNEAFEPIERPITLEGGSAAAAFALQKAEPLVLESEFAIRPPDGQVPPPLAAARLRLTLNGVEVATLEAPQLYALHRAMPVAPVTAVRPGENQIVITTDPAGLTAAVTMRVHNYTGINPIFPRVFVVPDGAVSHFFGSSFGRHGLRLLSLALLSVATIWGLALVTRQRAGEVRTLLLLSPSTLLWGTAIYSLLTPQHVWLSAGALGVVALLPIPLALAGLWLHRRRRALALATAVAAVVLLVVEGGLRLMSLIISSPAFHAGTYDQFRGRPGARLFNTQLNSSGFNDIEHTLARPRDVDYRIVALGDSVAFGVVPYADNYLTRLEGVLTPDGSVEVINMGVPGVAPRDYLALLVSEGLAFGPDLVLVSFFVGNDFDWEPEPLYTRSYLLSATRFFWALFTSGAPADTMFQGSSPTYDDAAPTFAPERFLEIEVGRARLFDPAAEGFDDALARAVDTLAKIRNAAARVGACTLIVLVPAEVQINADLAHSVERAYAAGPLDLERPNHALTEALDQEAITVLDLLPVFANEDRRTQLYKPRDTHWNIAGNRLAAETIAPAVAARIAEHP